MKKMLKRHIRNYLKKNQKNSFLEKELHLMKHVKKRHVKRKHVRKKDVKKRVVTEKIWETNTMKSKNPKSKLQAKK